MLDHSRDMKRQRGENHDAAITRLHGDEIFENNDVFAAMILDVAFAVTEVREWGRFLQFRLTDDELWAHILEKVHAKIRYASFTAFVGSLYDERKLFEVHSNVTLWTLHECVTALQTVHGINEIDTSNLGEEGYNGVMTMLRTADRRALVAEIGERIRTLQNEIREQEAMCEKALALLPENGK